MPGKRILELDGLRGIAAIMVVLYHYFYRYHDIYNHQNIPVNWSKYGQLGVFLFFMISGFVIFLTINYIKKPLDFIVSRFFRLYPVYWICVILTFALVSIFGLVGRETTWLDSVLNLTMFHQYFGIPNVDGVYWTLKVELTFYVFMFVLYLLKQLSRINYIIFFIFLLTFIGIISDIKILNKFSDILFIKIFPFFTLGILFYQLKYFLLSKSNIVLIIFSFILIYMLFSIATGNITLLFSLIFLLAINKKLTLLKHKSLIFLGTISYPLYLIHQNIGYIVIQKSYQYHLHTLSIIGLLIAALILVSYLLHQYIEIPILKYSKKLKSK